MDRSAFPPGYAAAIAAVTPGGSDDRGSDLESGALERALARAAARGIPLMRPVNLADSVSSRMRLFRSSGEPDLLLTIGGNYASTGAEAGLALLSGVIKPSQAIKTGSTGLVQEFLREGKPVVQVLNIEGLFARYGMPFDPPAIRKIGSGRVYRERGLPAALLLAPALAALAAFWVWRRRSGKTKGPA